MPAKTQYRSTNIIIQTILERILRADKNKPHERKGVIKSHLIKYCALKTSTAEKYLVKWKKRGILFLMKNLGAKEKLIFMKLHKKEEKGMNGS